MGYSILKKRKRGRVYKGTLGRPKKKTSQEEGPTQELVQRRQQLYGERSLNSSDQKERTDVLSSLCGSSLGFLRLQGVLSSQEYKTAEWFRSLAYSWRMYAKSPSYVVSKFSPILNKQKTYQKEVLAMDPREEERQERIEDILEAITKLFQKESPLVRKTFNAIILEDALTQDIRAFLLKRASQNRQEIKEERNAKYLIDALKKGIAIVGETRKQVRNPHL